MRRFRDLSIPVLAPVDLFLGQGLHVYKHLCGQFTRTAHLVEFRRHIIARRYDLSFWRDLRALAESNPRGSVGLGVVTLLITRLMGDFAPLSLTCWTVDRLAPAVRLWVETFAHDAIFTGSPGTKLHLLLQEALASTSSPRTRTLRKAILPAKAPRVFTSTLPNDNLFNRLRRQWNQFRFNLIRTRFHIREGLRYLRARRRWRNALARSAS